jgi:hypothetical protein
LISYQASKGFRDLSFKLQLERSAGGAAIFRPVAGAIRVYEDPAYVLRHTDEVGVRR